MDFLNHPETDRIITTGFEEDVKDGDHTSLATIPASAESSARCLIKDEGIVAGIDLAEKIFRTRDADCKFERFLEDGDRVKYGDVPFIVHAHTQSILVCERLVLNLMQRMSGIATYTRSLMDLIEGLDCKLLDTRKTTPLIRHFEKWAVTIGGGENHRFGLYDMMMIKDNHVDYAGGIENAILAANRYQEDMGLSLKIEVETRTVEEVKEVLRVGRVHRIMLDNMTAEQMRTCVDLIGRQYETEASGGITESNIREKAESGVDYISIGALTHSVDSLDISLKAIM